MSFQRSGPDLGALQVLQDANSPAFFVCGVTQALDMPRMIFMRSVRKIQPRYIHADLH
jgi:uncharacterized protein YcsI (UPF0317 family)